MSSEAIKTLRLSRWVRRRASLAVVVVLPEPCRPTIMIATGGTALRSMLWPSEPSVAISSSWTIFTTIWPGVTDLTTVAAIACSQTFSVTLRTTSSKKSAASRARRPSRIAASTSASVSAPRRVSRSRMPPSFSDRLSNTCFFLLPHPEAVKFKPAYTGRFGLKRAALGYWIARRNLSSGAHSRDPLAGDDDLVCLGATPRRYSKHFCARGRIALSGVDLRPQGPGGGSKRTSFRGLEGFTGQTAMKSRKLGTGARDDFPSHSKL